MILFFSFKGISQETQINDIMGTIITCGNDATGSSGTVTYSIGQVFYTYIGQLSVYNVAQGIQHQETVVTQKNLDTPENTESKIEIFIFPNPTSDFVNVNMKGFELENGKRSYQLFDMQGRVLRKNTINEIETQISLNNLSSSIYILQVYEDNKVLKTFKILKK